MIAHTQDRLSSLQSTLGAPSYLNAGNDVVEDLLFSLECAIKIYWTRLIAFVIKSDLLILVSL